MQFCCGSIPAVFAEAKELKISYENFLINTYFDSLDTDRFNSFREFETNETIRRIIQKYLEVNSEYPTSFLEEQGMVPADLMEKLGRNDFFGLIRKSPPRSSVSWNPVSPSKPTRAVLMKVAKVGAAQASGKCSHTRPSCTLRTTTFPIGLTLDACLNLFKIRYVIPLSGALEPDLRF